MGLSDSASERVPIVGIAAAPSGFNNCHRGIPELVEAVSRGVLAEGGLAAGVPHHFAGRGACSIPPA